MSFRFGDPVPPGRPPLGDGGAGAGSDLLEDGRRPQRADARRNRERVLASAAELFAAGGGAVGVEDIARHAGVGVGTVCRHFENKHALLDAVLEMSYRSLLDAALEASREPDPVEALDRLVLSSGELYARHRALAERARDGGLSPRTQELQQQVWALIDQLVVDAQAAGGIRSDVGPVDVIILLAGVAQTATVLSELDPALRERHIRLVLDGLRPVARSPLPGRPLDFDDLRRLRPGTAGTAPAPRSSRPRAGGSDGTT